MYGIPVFLWATNQLKLPPPPDGEAYMTLFMNHSMFVFPTRAGFTALESLMPTHTHTFWVQGLSNPPFKTQQKYSMPVSVLLWRRWPGEKIKSSIQILSLLIGGPWAASCLVPAPLWFVSDRSVSSQIAIGQPIFKKKEKKKTETKRLMPAGENLSRHVGNMSRTSWQPTVFLKWRANKLRIFIMQALSGNSARSFTNTAASKN